jgi:hypothetical protein
LTPRSGVAFCTIGSSSVIFGPLWIGLDLMFQMLPDWQRNVKGVRRKKLPIWQQRDRAELPTCYRNAG